MDKNISTSNGFPDKNIIESLGTITANTVIGMNLFKDFFSSITDIVGGESSSYRDTLDESINKAIKRLQKKASLLGANGIVSLRIDTNEISGQGKSMVMVTVYGTAVLTENITHSVEESQRIVSLKIANIINGLNYKNLCDNELLNNLRVSYNLTSEDFNSLFSQLIEKRKETFKNKSSIGVKEKELSNEATELIKKLKDDEMLVKIKINKGFGPYKIIKKSKYEVDVELHLSKNYQVIYKN
jgi:uncharacterized protein YbjQ (UPF0145 family)